MTADPRRLRRLRSTPALRRLVSETRLSPDRFVLPLFVADGLSEEEPLASLPGHYRWPAERVGLVAKEAEALGIPGVLIFGIPAVKDERGSAARAADGPTQRAIQEIKSAAPGLVVFADTCLCEYTSHGHCGIVENGEVLNDATVEVLAATAVSQAEAGADFVAPSDMMDGRVGAIRKALDAAGYTDTGILAYSAKYNSAYYGPFRDAVGSAKAAGTRLLSKATYQMNP